MDQTSLLVGLHHPEPFQPRPPVIWIIFNQDYLQQQSLCPFLL